MAAEQSSGFSLWGAVTAGAIGLLMLTGGADATPRAPENVAIKDCKIDGGHLDCEATMIWGDPRPWQHTTRTQLDIPETALSPYLLSLFLNDQVVKEAFEQSMEDFLLDSIDRKVGRPVTPRPGIKGFFKSQGEKIIEITRTALFSANLESEKRKIRKSLETLQKKLDDGEAILTDDAHHDKFGVA